MIAVFLQTERIKRTILKNSKANGGLGMPDISIKNKALKINWVKRLENSAHLAIFIYRTTFIKNTDIWKCNIQPKDINDLFQSTPNTFIKDIFMAWAEYTFKEPENIQDILNQFIWLNSHIKINGTPAFHKLMYTSGIKYIKQLLDPDGNILQYQDFIIKYNIQVSK